MTNPNATPHPCDRPEPEAPKVDLDKVTVPERPYVSLKMDYPENIAAQLSQARRRQEEWWEERIAEVSVQVDRAVEAALDLQKMMRLLRREPK